MRFGNTFFHLDFFEISRMWKINLRRLNCIDNVKHNVSIKNTFSNRMHTNPNHMGCNQITGLWIISVTANTAPNENNREQEIQIHAKYKLVLCERRYLCFVGSAQIKNLLKRSKWTMWFEFRLVYNQKQTELYGVVALSKNQ